MTTNDNERDALRERVAEVIDDAIRSNHAMMFAECEAAADTAIAAMQPEIDAAYQRGLAEGRAEHLTLDERLNQFHLETNIVASSFLDGSWEVFITWPTSTDTDGSWIDDSVSLGHGPTREAALDDAIAKALEAKEQGR